MAKHMVKCFYCGEMFDCMNDVVMQRGFCYYGVGTIVSISNYVSRVIVCLFYSSIFLSSG